MSSEYTERRFREERAHSNTCKPVYFLISALLFFVYSYFCVVVSSLQLEAANLKLPIFVVSCCARTVYNKSITTTTTKTTSTRTTVTKTTTNYVAPHKCNRSSNNFNRQITNLMDTQSLDFVFVFTCPTEFWCILCSWCVQMRLVTLNER